MNMHIFFINILLSINYIFVFASHRNNVRALKKLGFIGSKKSANKYNSNKNKYYNGNYNSYNRNMNNFFVNYVLGIIVVFGFFVFMILLHDIFIAICNKIKKKHYVCVEKTD